MPTTNKGRRIAGLLALAVVVTAVTAVWANWGWIEFYLEFEPLGKNEQGYREYRHRQTGIVFVRVPGGTFQMGANDEDRKLLGERERGIDIESLLETELPRHEVFLSGFLIAKYEVSQAEWERVTGKNPSRTIDPELPVDIVSWEECQAFCDQVGFSLPREAEWEYACRAGTTTVYSFGESLSPESANYGDPGFDLSGKAAPVDEFPANGFGLHNMHGNVREFCFDFYDPQFYSQPRASGKNPENSDSGWLRVLRGGSCFTPATQCRSASRSAVRPTGRSLGIGFRPVYRFDDSKPGGISGPLGLFERTTAMETRPGSGPRRGVALSSTVGAGA